MRRRRRILGASARPTRERTGVPHIDREAVWTAAKDVVDTFPECGGKLDAGRRPIHASTTSIVKDISTGKPMTVKVWVQPIYGVNHLVAGGVLDPWIDDKGERHPSVTLTAGSVCAPEYAWRSALENVLVHEFTHVADPLVWKKEAKYRGAVGSCAYYGDPREVTAFLGQMRDELRDLNVMNRITAAKRSGKLRKPEDLLPFSREWKHLEPCLSPKQRKRFLRLAGDTWKHIFSDPDLYGARVLGSVDWMKYADDQAWRTARGDVHAEVVQEAYDMGHGELKLHAKIGERTVGELEAWTHPEGKSVGVSNIAVGPKGRGIGTKLYEEAARWACRVARRPLSSDEKRSAASDAFWKKQVRKKRARCAWRLQGEEAASVREEQSITHDDKPLWARGGCVRYELQCPAPKTLAGRKR